MKKVKPKRLEESAAVQALLNRRTTIGCCQNCLWWEQVKRQSGWKIGLCTQPDRPVFTVTPIQPLLTWRGFGCILFEEKEPPCP